MQNYLTPVGQLVGNPSLWSLPVEGELYSCLPDLALVLASFRNDVGARGRDVDVGIRCLGVVGRARVADAQLRQILGDLVFGRLLAHWVDEEVARMAELARARHIQWSCRRDWLPVGRGGDRARTFCLGSDLLLLDAVGTEPSSIACAVAVSAAPSRALSRTDFVLTLPRSLSGVSVARRVLGRSVWPEASERHRPVGRVAHPHPCGIPVVAHGRAAIAVPGQAPVSPGAPVACTIKGCGWVKSRYPVSASCSLAITLPMRNQACTGLRACYVRG